MTFESESQQPLTFGSSLELHARYGSLDISTALGLTTIAQIGQTGVDVADDNGTPARHHGAFLLATGFVLLEP